MLESGIIITIKLLNMEQKKRYEDLTTQEKNNAVVGMIKIVVGLILLGVGIACFI